MPATLIMNDVQRCSAGLALLDQDGQPIVQIPEGAVVTFESSDANVAVFTAGPDGLNGVINSGLVGSCVITGTISFPGGVPLSDIVAVTIVNSPPASVSFSVGTPEPEGP